MAKENSFIRELREIMKDTKDELKTNKSVSDDDYFDIDLQAELERKFDELFGSLDSDEEGNS